MQKSGFHTVDGILYDLGVSSPQLDTPERGFSYNHDAPLDMRMDTDASLTAYDVVNEWSYEDLVRIFFRYGEEKFSKSIARKIEEAREESPIETTAELAELDQEWNSSGNKTDGRTPSEKSFPSYPHCSE